MILKVVCLLGMFVCGIQGLPECKMLHWTVHLKVATERTHHAAVAVEHKVYSFGGHSNNIKISDQIVVHIFNTVSLRWMTLPPVTAGIGDLPSMREGHTAVLIDYIIYIWGGLNLTGKYCNVLYGFDVNTHRWVKPRVSGTTPEVMESHSSCAVRKVMYIFGGFNMMTGCTNDIHKLDTTTMVWSFINTTGTPAPVSSGHSSTIIGTNMFVFGGQGDQVDQYYNDVMVFDTETNCWLSTPPAQLLPKERESHSAFAYNGELYIFGGDDMTQMFNDLWKYNPESFSWTKVEPRGTGPQLWMSWMCCCMVADRVILFRDYGHTPNDLYILDLSPSLKTLCKVEVIQAGLDQSGLPHDIKWELSVMTTNGKKKKKRKYR